MTLGQGCCMTTWMGISAKVGDQYLPIIMNLRRNPVCFILYLLLIDYSYWLLKKEEEENIIGLRLCQGVVGYQVWAFGTIIRKKRVCLIIQKLHQQKSTRFFVLLSKVKKQKLNKLLHEFDNKMLRQKYLRYIINQR